jgi:hypothetical protein
MILNKICKGEELVKFFNKKLYWINVKINIQTLKAIRMIKEEILKFRKVKTLLRLLK